MGTVFAKLYLLYWIPTYALEALWLTSLYFIAFVAATFAIRLVWSLLLLFILYPAEVQLIIYLATVGAVIIKVQDDLNLPFEKIKTWLI